MESKSTSVIEVKTFEQSVRGTISSLYVDGVFICFALELPWRDNKRNVSCVPAGVYPVKFELSAHFKSKLWELKKVPERSEVKIHVANRLSQLQGCIAVGLGIKIGKNGMFETVSSKVALENLHRVTSSGDIEVTQIVISGKRT